jgi:glutamate:GABA antiporter
VGRNLGVIPTLGSLGEQQSARLKRELRCSDLVMMQLVLVVTPQWVGTAAKQGPTHVWFWLIAILLFYVPEILVVAYLSRMFPLEGGIYQWAKFGLGPFVGFIAAWNLCFFMIIGWSSIGLTTATDLGYAFGNASWSNDYRPIIAVSVVVFGAIWLVNSIGFHFAKWLVNSGGVMTLCLFSILVVLLLFKPGHHLTTPRLSFSFALPAVSLTSINLFSKVALGALGGLDNASVFAGESRNPFRDIGRSVWIAAPLIALMYILASGALLAYVVPEQVDLVAPIPQLLGVAAESSSILVWIRVITILTSSVIAFVTASVCIGSVSRMPMVSGWDGLMPGWFSQVNERTRIPVHSISIVTMIAFSLGLMSMMGANKQEAFQLLFTAAFACCGIYYLIMFAIPLLSFRHLSPKPSFLLRIAAFSGTIVTVLSIGFQFFPIIDISHRWLFAAKLGLIVTLANLVGYVIYRGGSRRQRAGCDAVIPEIDQKDIEVW